MGSSRSKLQNSLYNTKEFLFLFERASDLDNSITQEALLEKIQQILEDDTSLQGNPEGYRNALNKYRFQLAKDAFERFFQSVENPNDPKSEDDWFRIYIEHEIPPSYLITNELPVALAKHRVFQRKKVCFFIRSFKSKSKESERKSKLDVDEEDEELFTFLSKIYD